MNPQYQHQSLRVEESDELSRLLDQPLRLPESKELKKMPESVCSLFAPAKALTEGEIGYETSIKCNRQAKTWHHLDQNALNRGLEVLVYQVESIVLADVSFRTATARQAQIRGCSLVPVGTEVSIGYARGLVVKKYSFNPGMLPVPIKWNHKLGSFTDFENRPINGAEVVLLDENCKAAAINPSYTS